MPKLKVYWSGVPKVKVSQMSTYFGIKYPRLKQGKSGSGWEVKRHEMCKILKELKSERTLVNVLKVKVGQKVGKLVESTQGESRTKWKWIESSGVP